MLEWILTSSLLILVVLILRAALGKRIGAGLRYALWAVVLVRLLVPVSFFTVTVPQLPKWAPPETMQEESIYVLPVGSLPLEDSGVHVAEDGTLGDPDSFGYPRLTNDGERVVRYADKISPLELLCWIWVAGAVVMGAVLVIANLRFSVRLRRVRKPLEGTPAPVPVYMAPGLPSPCLMGLARPAVYVTEETAADPAMLRHVLAHELTHYNHLDHVWSVLRGVALAIHWWNPLVWVAVVCSRRDGELACDEGALKRLGDGERAAYGETLLFLVTAKSKPGDLFCFATTMRGGKRSLKERIQRIANQPKRLAGAVVVVVVVISLTTVAAFGQAKETQDDAEDDPPVETMSDHLPGEPVPVASDVREDAWENAEILLDADGVAHIRCKLPDGSIKDVSSNPIPAPREWADLDTLDSRKEATALEYLPIIWAKLVTPSDGWLVATYERGVAAADTYVYKTADGGLNWTEVSRPGTSWHLSIVGFLSAERLIVAQRLFDGAPCFITKDGGQTWEEILLPDTMVTAFSAPSGKVTLYIGPNEYSRTTFLMTSDDLGDTWITAPLAQSVDLDHDGRPDTLEIRTEPDPSGWSYDGTLWTLQCDLSGGGIWEIEGYPSLPGCNAVFLYQMDGEDYLLVYTPNFWHGQGYYDYRLIWLDGGREVVVQENSVAFDARFRGGPDDIGFDPEAIAAFMDEVNALLANSVQLVNTNIYLGYVFAGHGRLYDDLYWLDDEFREEGLTLLEILQNYKSYCGDHPDDAWSPLADLLEGLTEEDFPTPDEDTAELVQALRAAERGSRFYTWGGYAAACDGLGVDDRPSRLFYVSLVDGSVLWLFASEENDNVLMMLEAPGGMTSEVVSAYYTAPELNEYIKSIPVILD